MLKNNKIDTYREFNVTGNCVPDMHYMVDISDKLNQIKKLVDKGKYFTINRARQYGKTTTRYALESLIHEEYLVINISFEGIGDLIFTSEKSFAEEVFNIFASSFSFTNEELEKEIRAYGQGVTDINKLSKAITLFCKEQSKKIVLMIDEVDKASNNQLFISFLGMLRDKFIARNIGKDLTFHSVILLSVYDIKNLKLKLRPDEEKKFNSPWNIATNFEVEMSFNPQEISTMLAEYEKDNKTNMNIMEISHEIHKYTNGYPFLVSKICKVIHEKLNKNWSKDGVREAVKIIVREKTTLSDDLIKNLENNKSLYESIFNQLILGEEVTFNIHNEMTELGVMFGFFRESEGKRIIHNKIFEEIIYEYMSSEIDQTERLTPYNFRNNFIGNDGSLNIEKILIKFQQMMKEEYSSRDKSFLEREGRLLFIAFLRPIINGIGFALKEVQISEEQRLDIVITYNNNKYIIELKKWYGEEYHQRGLKQLENYLENQGLNRGYLIIYNFNKNKEYTSEWTKENDKDIFTVVV